MKETWTAPRVSVQQFRANEYVSACIVGKVACELPGASSTALEFDSNGHAYYDGNIYHTHLGHKDDAWHGLCANEADISFNPETGVGSGNETQYNNGSFTAVDNRVIKVTGGSYNANELNVWQPISWESSNDNWKSSYSHEGFIKISYVDTNRPNHS